MLKKKRILLNKQLSAIKTSSRGTEEHQVLINLILVSSYTQNLNISQIGLIKRPTNNKDLQPVSYEKKNLFILFFLIKLLEMETSFGSE